jgi:hypothetical protein
MKPEIIVYRSPFEAAMWDLITSTLGSQMILWLVCAGIVANIVYFAPLPDVLFNLHQRAPRWLFNRWTVLAVAIMVTHTLYLGAKWLLTYL